MPYNASNTINSTVAEGCKHSENPPGGETVRQENQVVQENSLPVANVNINFVSGQNNAIQNSTQQQPQDRQVANTDDEIERLVQQRLEAILAARGFSDAAGTSTHSSPVVVATPPRPAPPANTQSSPYTPCPRPLSGPRASLANSMQNSLSAMFTNSSPPASVRHSEPQVHSDVLSDALIDPVLLDSTKSDVPSSNGDDRNPPMPMPTEAPASETSGEQSDAVTLHPRFDVRQLCPPHTQILTSFAIPNSAGEDEVSDNPLWENYKDQLARWYIRNWSVNNAEGIDSLITHCFGPALDANGTLPAATKLRKWIKARTKRMASNWQCEILKKWGQFVSLPNVLCCFTTLFNANILKAL